jgi:hypothetical protein
MKVGDLVKMKRYPFDLVGLVINISETNLGKWPRVLWPDHFSDHQPSTLDRYRDPEQHAEAMTLYNNNKKRGNMANCITCEEEYSDKRLELGYMTCLNCGQADAATIINARNKQKLAEIAPRLASGEFKEIEKQTSWDDSTPQSKDDEDK